MQTIVEDYRMARCIEEVEPLLHENFFGEVRWEGRAIFVGQKGEFLTYLADYFSRVEVIRDSWVSEEIGAGIVAKAETTLEGELIYCQGKVKISHRITFTFLEERILSIAEDIMESAACPQ